MSPSSAIDVSTTYFPSLLYKTMNNVGTIFMKHIQYSNFNFSVGSKFKQTASETF